MFSTKFGIEIEFTGITRELAAEIVAKVTGGFVTDLGGYYGVYTITAPDGRIWKVMYDSSIRCQVKRNGTRCSASREYSVELVSPILVYYPDMTTLQQIVRKLRLSGGLTNRTCGIHVHLDGSPHTPRSLWNFINLVASRNDLFYKAFRIPPERQSYCRKMDEYLVRALNELRPTTMEKLESIWYMGYGESRNRHYHNSRYHFLNLHSFFNGNGTVELRGFNSELHAGKVRAYVVFALAINHQALTQKYARYVHVQEENEKFAMRVYLVRIGLSGDEFKSCRQHLYQHLDGCAAWRYGSKEQCRSRRKSAPKSHKPSVTSESPYMGIPERLEEEEHEI